MRRAALSELMRWMISLFSGSPGTMAKRPPRSAKAPSSVSRRSGLSRVALSGPWQVKHLSERIGRMSRLNSTTFAPESLAPPAANPQNKTAVTRANA